MTKQRRLRLGMVGGGEGAFIGAVHRIAARLDDEYEFVAGSMSSNPERARASGAALELDDERNYGTFREMARAEAQRADPIDAVSIVTPNNVHHEVATTFLEAGFHIICDKPLTTDLASARELVSLARKTSRVFVVTYNYSGYPMVRQARAMIAAGEIGDVRIVQAEYPQEWLAEKVEDMGSKQAMWRTDPERSGPSGCLGDIGTHAYHLSAFVTGLSVTEVAADLSTFVAGRVLDDNAHLLLRYESGAKGMLWASQIARGHENGLRLRVYGSKGALSWFQEEPNSLAVARRGQPVQRMTRGGPAATEAATLSSRIPGGHPEGYLEAFAQIYRDAAEMIRAADSGKTSNTLAPTVVDGADGVAFIESALESSRANGRWVRIAR